MSTTQLVHLTGNEENAEVPVLVKTIGDDQYTVTVDGTDYEVEAFRTDKGIAFRLEGRSRDVSVDRRDGSTSVVEVLGQQTTLELVDNRIHQLEKAKAANAGAVKPLINSPMAGKVILVKVAPGDVVAEGDTLLIIEAMKMENEIKAAGPATVQSVDVAPDDTIEKGALLITFELDED